MRFFTPPTGNLVERTLKRWAWVCFVMVLAGGVLQFQLHSIWHMVAFIAAAGIFSAYQWYFIYHNRHKNVHSDSSRGSRTTLGLANWLSIFRGQLSALLLGFAVNPRPAGAWAWLPGLLFLTAALLDLADGYVARVRGEETRLGEELDMFLDGTAVLAASLAAVWWGLAPWLYILVGLARYLFLFGMHLRERRNLPNYDLDPRMIRRALAGSQMGYLAVVLLPIFSPPATVIAGIVFMTPFLFHFVRDWLVVSGKMQPGRDVSIIPDWAPLIIRGLTFAGLVLWIFQWINTPADLAPVVALSVLAALILMGAAGRFAALLVVFGAGFAVAAEGLAIVLMMNLVFGSALFFSGTGKYSLWKPEDRIIYQRAGEKQNS